MCPISQTLRNIKTLMKSNSYNHIWNRSKESLSRYRSVILICHLAQTTVPRLTPYCLLVPTASKDWHPGPKCYRKHECLKYLSANVISDFKAPGASMRHYFCPLGINQRKCFVGHLANKVV